MFKPSEQQLAIFDGAKKGENLIINAGPGSGKSTTLVQNVNELPSNKNILVVVFNNRNMWELKKKLPSNCTVVTAHSLGNSLCFGIGKKWVPNDKLNPKKHGSIDNKFYEVNKWMIRDQGFDKQEKLQITQYLCDICDKIRITLTDYEDENAVANLCANFNLPFLRYDLIKECMKNMNNAAYSKSWVDFADMLYLPHYYDRRITAKTQLNRNPVMPFDYILMDEAQDFSMAMLELIKRFISSNTVVIGVGDTMQSINGFAGSMPNSMELIQQTFNMRKLPLNITYRCPQTHVDNLNSTFGTDLICGNENDGSINSIDPFDVANYVELGDLVIAPTQRGKDSLLLPTMQQVLNQGIPCRLLGFNLSSIISNINIFEDTDIIDVYALGKYNQMIIDLADELNEKYWPKAAIDNIIEEYMFVLNVMTFFVDYEIGKTWKDFVSFVTQMENNTDEINCVTFSTIHKAKGGESNNVFILNNSSLPMVKEDNLDWVNTQAINVQYVALSRSKDNLYLVG